ncbi:hypothetical protein Pmani_022400 [Petrolisthes manimaculis]|uniref:Uncharacterized protein n=1 Tax=Petrolisthes manimaculis TaxID=1843537 RepID=A0AAE1PDZ5_9EUCA|nr:hypothetical protein Pmani_022400 [Petrolisthes manimaculis]
MMIHKVKHYGARNGGGEVEGKEGRRVERWKEGWDMERCTEGGWENGKVEERRVERRGGRKVRKVGKVERLKEGREME